MRTAAKILLVLAVAFGVSFAQHQQLVKLYRQGEKSFEQGDFRNAHSLFTQVANQSTDRDLRAKAMYMKALSSYKLGEYQNAAYEFGEFEKVFPEHPLVYRAALYAGNAYFYQKNYLQSAQQYAFALLSDDPREQRVAESALEKLLWGYLPLDLFPSLLDRVDRSVEAVVGKMWLRRLQHDGEYAKALREGQKLLQRVYDPQDKKQLQRELEKIEEYLKKHLVIAVLVPKTGDYAKYGNEVLRGVKLAFDNSDVTVELKEIDSGGDPLTTARAVNDLLQETTPLCIIGPVTSNETVAAGAIAGTYRVPLITPSASRDGIAELSPYVFQLVASPVKASKYLASFVADTMDTFAILAPDDKLGHDCAMAFASEVSKKDRTIIGAQFYPLGTVDFSEYLTKLRQPVVDYIDQHLMEIDTTDTAVYDCSSDTGCVQKKPEEWTIHFDGIFIPGYYNDVEVVLPQIPFMYISATPLGVNGWIVNDLRKSSTARKYLDGAIIIPDDFYVCEDNPKWKEFAKLYRRTYGRSPTRLAALGYDAATLCIMGIKNNALTQELMRDYLSGVYDFDGAAGPVSFDENGANSEAVILQFIGDQPVRVK